MAPSRLVHLFLAVACVGFVACSSPQPQNASDTGSDATDDQAADDAMDEGDDVPEGFARKDCAELAKAMAGAAGAGMSGNMDIDFDKAIEGLRRAGDAAPEELRDDFTVFGDAMAEYFELLRDAGIDFNDPSSFSSPQAQKAVQKGTALLQDPKVEQARKNIDKGMREICEG